MKQRAEMPWFANCNKARKKTKKVTPCRLEIKERKDSKRSEMITHENAVLDVGAGRDVTSPRVGELVTVEDVEDTLDDREGEGEGEGEAEVDRVALAEVECVVRDTTETGSVETDCVCDEVSELVMDVDGGDDEDVKTVKLDDKTLDDLEGNDCELCDDVEPDDVDVDSPEGVLGACDELGLWDKETDVDCVLGCDTCDDPDEVDCDTDDANELEDV